jgi:hypothetical protein
MASGHGYRTQRPNTWLLRPMLQREDSSCQPGAVHTWPLADLSGLAANVCCRSKSGHRSGPRGGPKNDPKPTWGKGVDLRLPLTRSDYRDDR